MENHNFNEQLKKLDTAIEEERKASIAAQQAAQVTMESAERLREAAQVNMESAERLREAAGQLLRVADHHKECADLSRQQQKILQNLMEAKSNGEILLLFCFSVVNPLFPPFFVVFSLCGLKNGPK